jgi:hypothetical protein
MNYLLSEKTKKSLDGLISEHGYNLTGQSRGRRPAPAGVGRIYSGPFAIENASTPEVPMRIKVRGYAGESANSVDSYICIDTGVGMYMLQFPETELSVPEYAYSYVLIDWWFDLVQAGWVASALCRFDPTVLLTDHDITPDRISREIIGKVVCEMEDGSYAVKQVRQWKNGVIYARARSY